MPTCCVAPHLSNRLREIAENWGSRGSLSLRFDLLAIAAGGLALLLLVLWLRGRWRRCAPPPTPPRLFRRVATSLGLSGSQRRLLTRIASHAMLASPVTLLCSPATLAQHAEQFGRSLPVWRRAALQRDLALLRDHLFGDEGS